MILTKEVKDLNFGLDNSLCLASGVSYSLERYRKNRPPEWLKFISYLFPERIKGNDWLLKFDSAFQFFHIGSQGELLHCIVG